MMNLTRLDLVIFADDTNIFCRGKEIQQLCHLYIVSHARDGKVQMLFAINKLPLNITKTNFKKMGYFEYAIL